MCEGGGIGLRPLLGSRQGLVLAARAGTHLDELQQRVALAAQHLARADKLGDAAAACV